MAEKRRNTYRDANGNFARDPQLGPRKEPRKLGPYSRQLRRGVIAAIDGRSPQGRFARDLEAQLIAHIGGAPSIIQKILIERMIKIRLQLDLFEAKLAAGEWTAHDARTYGALNNAIRLTAREIGIKSIKPPAPTLGELRAQIARDRASAA